MFHQDRLGAGAFTVLLQNTEDGEIKDGQLETILAMSRYKNMITQSDVNQEDI
jgi:hypothetical protein